MNNKCFIYIIKNPISGNIRYVGQSTVGVKRFYTQVSLAKLKNKTPVQKFITKYLNEGYKPLFEIIEYCDLENINDREIYWIDYYKKNGINLLNLTIGGEGSKGRIVSEETKKRQSLSKLGKKLSIEHKNNCSKTFFKKGQISWNAGMKMPKSFSDSVSKGKRGIPNISLSKKIICSGRIFDSMKLAAKHYNISITSVFNSCNKKHENKDGLIFNYVK